MKDEIPEEVTAHFREQRQRVVDWLLKEDLENCQSCDAPPEIQGTRARCSTENCFLRSIMGWMSARLWNETMNDLRNAEIASPDQPGIDQ